MNLQTLYRPLALLVVVSLILAGTFTGSSGNASADSNSAGEPAGQLTRRGVTGEVVSAGGGSIVIETKFGNVTIGVTDGTIIKSKGETLALEDIKPGDRAGVLLDRAPDVLKAKDSDEDGDSEDVDLSVPSTGDDTGAEPDLTPTPVTDDTGADPDLTPTPEVDDPGTDPEPTATPTATPDVTPPATSDDTSADTESTATPTPTLTPPDSSGDTGTDPDLSVPSNIEDAGSDPDPKPPVVESFRQDVTALRITVVSAPTRKHECVVVTSTGEDTTSVLDEDGNEIELEGDAGVEGEDVCLLTRGKKGGGKEITGSIGSNAVDERLARMAEKNEALAERLAEKKAEVEVKRQERLDRTVNNAPEDKKGKAEGARSSNQNRGSGGGGSTGSGGSSGGGGNTGGGNTGGGGNSGGGNSGGGNTGGGGNSGGGGPPEDKGKPDNENKGKKP